MVKLKNGNKLIHRIFILAILLILCCSCQPAITATVEFTSTPFPASPTKTNTPTPLPSATPTPTNQVNITSDGSIVINFNNVITPTLSEGSQWLAVTFFDQQSETYNVLVKDLFDIQNLKWIKLFSESSSLLGQPDIQFSPDAKFLAVVTDENIWIFKTGEWENPQKYTYNTYMRFF